MAEGGTPDAPASRAFWLCHDPATRCPPHLPDVNHHWSPHRMLRGSLPRCNISKRSATVMADLAVTWANPGCRAEVYTPEPWVAAPRPSYPVKDPLPSLLDRLWHWHVQACAQLQCCHHGLRYGYSASHLWTAFPTPLRRPGRPHTRKQSTSHRAAVRCLGYRVEVGHQGQACRTQRHRLVCRARPHCCRRATAAPAAAHSCAHTRTGQQCVFLITSTACDHTPGDTGDS